MAEYEEYRLFSSGKNNFNLKNHILKLSSQKFTLDSLARLLQVRDGGNCLSFKKWLNVGGQAHDLNLKGETIKY